MVTVPLQVNAAASVCEPWKITRPVTSSGTVGVMPMPRRLLASSYFDVPIVIVPFVAWSVVVSVSEPPEASVFEPMIVGAYTWLAVMSPSAVLVGALTDPTWRYPFTFASLKIFTGEITDPLSETSVVQPWK